MKEKLKRILPVGVFLVFTVFFYGPLSLYLPNAQEFWFDLKSLLSIINLVSIVIFICICLVGIMLPNKLNGFYTMLLFGIALAAYIQGNFINLNYGVLDGTGIDWAKYKTYAVVNSLIWIICILLPFIVAFILKKMKKDSGTIYLIILYASLFFTAIQIPALISQRISYTPGYKGNLSVTTDEMFSVAKNDNTFVIIVDTYDEMYFAQYMISHPEYEEQFQGFTHFENTLTAAARTIVALPAMFTGQPFLKDTTYSQYLKNTWSKENVFRSYHDAGYDTRVFTTSDYFSDDTIDYIDNFTSDSSLDNPKILLQKVYKLTGFKFVPHVLKKKFEMETKEFDEARIALHNINLFQENDFLFFEDFSRNGFTISEDLKKTFRMYHLDGIHRPYKMGRDGKKNDSSTLEEQTEGIMLYLSAMLNDMRRKGIYDASTIIICADHGDVNLAERPLLLYKPKNATGTYTISQVPVSLFDLAVVLTDNIGSPLKNQQYGMNFTKLNETDKRERHFFINTSNSSQVVIDEYSTTEHANNKAFVKVMSHEDTPSEEELYYRFGEVLSFESEATGNRYAKVGLSLNTGWRTMTAVPLVSLEIPYRDLPDADTFVFSLGVTSITEDKKMLVKVNDVQLADIVLSLKTASNGITFDIPRDILKKSETIHIDFVFPDVPMEMLEKPMDERPSYVSFINLVIAEK